MKDFQAIVLVVGIAAAGLVHGGMWLWADGSTATDLRTVLLEHFGDVLR